MIGLVDGFVDIRTMTILSWTAVFLNSFDHRMFSFLLQNDKANGDRIHAHAS